MDIKNLILTEGRKQHVIAIKAEDLELAFGYVAAKNAKRPLIEIVAALDEWCRENRFKYLYKPPTNEYVFAGY